MPAVSHHPTLNIGGLRAGVWEFFAIALRRAATIAHRGCEPERGGDAIIIANAAVIVSLDDGTSG
jgi:hypothetical protein